MRKRFKWRERNSDVFPIQHASLIPSGWEDDQLTILTNRIVNCNNGDSLIAATSAVVMGATPGWESYDCPSVDLPYGG